MLPECRCPPQRQRIRSEIAFGRINRELGRMLLAYLVCVSAVRLLADFLRSLTY